MRLCFIVVFWLLACGCFPDREVIDPTGGALDDAGFERPDVDTTETTFASSYTTRTTQLEFIGPPASDLNGVIAVSLDPALPDPIIFLYTLSEIDAENGSATLEIANGEKAEDTEFRIDETGERVSSSATFDGTNGSFTATFPRYRFIGTITFGGDSVDVEIPITDLRVEGTLVLESDTEAAIRAGAWSGHIPKSDGDSTVVQLVPGEAPRTLTEIFREETLDYDIESETIVDLGEGDAWLIEARYVCEPAVVQR